MCGIFGYMATKKANHSLIFNSLAKRGPDGNGEFTTTLQIQGIKKFIGLLHTRLAIFDTRESGNQPIHSRDKRYSIIFNGEIYNHYELRKILELKGYHFDGDTDTEVLLYAYIEWKEQVFSKLEGMYAFAVWDQLEKKFFVARDHVGIKPLYLYHDDYHFLIILL